MHITLKRLQNLKCISQYHHCCHCHKNVCWYFLIFLESLWHILVMPQAKTLIFVKTLNNTILTVYYNPNLSTTQNICLNPGFRIMFCFFFKFGNKSYYFKCYTVVHIYLHDATTMHQLQVWGQLSFSYILMWTLKSILFNIPAPGLIQDLLTWTKMGLTEGIFQHWVWLPKGKLYTLLFKCPPICRSW